MRTKGSALRVAVVANPTAGRGRGARLIPDVERTLESLGIPHATIASRDAAAPARLAEQAARRGADVVVALGGDGHVSAVANGILASESQAALAVVPAGTGNDFARALGLDRRDPLSAVRLLADPAVASIDAVRLETPQRAVHYVNVGSVGFDSEVNAYANRMSVLSGNPKYVAATFATLARFRPSRFELAVDGQRYGFRGMLIAVGNGVSYGGGMKVTPHARLDDGLIDVCALGALPKPRFVMAFPKVFTGRHVDHPAVRMFRGRRVEVSADRELQVFADGEHVGILPASFSVLPGALRAVVPPPRP